MAANNSYASTMQSDNARAAIAEIKGLTVDKLKKILRSEGLTVSGIKTELQVRLIGYIERSNVTGDFARIDRVRSSINGVSGFANPYPSPYSNHTPNASLSPQFTSPTPRIPAPPSSFSMAPYNPLRLSFKSSPFYTITKSLSSVLELKAREQTRDTARISLRLESGLVEQLQRDTNTRIMVFCAAESLGSRSEPADITFPQHGELKCNSDDVKHNLKGMKGKPGTTRPADITQYIRRTLSFPNNVELVYALTTKKYYLVVNVVQKRPIDSLVNEIKLRGTPFTKDGVIRAMRSKADDPDIVATSTNMSLKDPLQMTRIQTPCRGLSCTHNSCFDAAVYLALQEQAPTWTCPICHKPTIWENVVFDQYFADILKNVDDDTEQVTVEPDGRWHRGDPPSTDNHQNRSGSGIKHDPDYDDDDDDDDVVEITESRISGLRDFARTPSINRTSPFDTTPTQSSVSLNYMVPQPTVQDISTPSSARSNKRQHSETIDLTLDDSEDDEQPPIARIKRPALSTQSSDAYGSRSTQIEPYSFHMPPPNTTFNQSRYNGF